MTAFPKPLRRDGEHGRITLTPEQEAWVRRYFPTTKGATMRAMMGVSLSTFYRLVRSLGVSKTAATRARIYRACGKKGRETCERNGYYDSLRGKQLSPQCMEASRQRWLRVKDGELPSPRAQMRKERPRAYKQMVERVAVKRRRLIRMEKLRLMSGMAKETKLKLALNPYTRSQANHRCNALKRGYWFYEDCSEQGGERYNIYYDQDTERLPRFEENLRNDGFNVLDGTAAGNDGNKDG